MHSTFLGNFYVNNPEAAGISGPAYESASIEWAIKVQIFDAELGRNFWMSKSVRMRPFIGQKQDRTIIYSFKMVQATT